MGMASTFTHLVPLLFFVRCHGCKDHIKTLTTTASSDTVAAPSRSAVAAATSKLDIKKEKDSTLLARSVFKPVLEGKHGRLQH